MTHRQSFHGKNATMTSEVPDEIRVYLAGPDTRLIADAAQGFGGSPLEAVENLARIAAKALRFNSQTSSILRMTFGLKLHCSG